MIVDDAIVVRSLLKRWIEAEPDMAVAATLRTGREAIDHIESCDPDVAVLDVDMPVLDGISALPAMLKKKRDLVVIMASTLTRRGAEVSLKALSLGAADYVPKPQARPDASTSEAFHRELIEKIRNLGRRGRMLDRQGTFDRRPPGAHRPGRKIRQGARAGTDLDHAAYAGDVHDGARRASDARQRPECA